MENECQNCGAPTSQTWGYCEECGSPLGASGATSRGSSGSSAGDYDGPKKNGADAAESGNGAEPVGFTMYPRDYERVLREVLRLVEERGEYCYVYRGAPFVYLEHRAGTSVLMVSSNPGLAGLSPDGEALLVNGGPLDTRRWRIRDATGDEDDGSPPARHLLVLVRASFAGPDGEPSVRNVSPLERLGAELFVDEPEDDPVTVDRRAEWHWSSERLARSGVELVHRPTKTVIHEEAREPDHEALAAAMEKLEKLVGLGSVKAEVRKLTNLVAMRQKRIEHGLPVLPVSLHLVLTGNPGTGKTTVARILAEIYGALGLLSKGHLVETGRSELVGQHVGETALKTRAKLEEAAGGMLFIDEAYALVPEVVGNDFGPEAVAEILRRMENHREDLVVVVAGYSRPMQRFINSNEGLRSRFKRTIDFPDYSPDEMMQILQGLCAEHGYHLTDEARERANAIFAVLRDLRGTHFGNGREVRSIFEDATTNQANRLSAFEDFELEDLTAIEAQDLPASEPSSDQDQTRREAREYRGER